MNKMTRITSGVHDDKVLYFTSNSVLANDKRLVFIRKVNDCNNLFVLDLETGEETQITHFFDKAPYCLPCHHFRMNDYSDINVATIVLHSKTEMLYFIKGRELHRYNLKGNGRILTTIPKKLSTGCGHVNEAGTKYLISGCDDRAFDTYDGTNGGEIDKRMHSLDLCSYLLEYDTETGDLVNEVPVRNAWVTHVQYCPLNDNLILYNHEWVKKESGIRRMWLYDGKQHIALRTEEDGRCKEDWTCHEMWERDTGNIIYHGKYTDGKGGDGIAYIGRVVFDDVTTDITKYKLVEIALPENYTLYGHFSVSNSNLLVSDGYYEEEGLSAEEKAKAKGGEWLTILKANWDDNTIDWYPVCKHGSSWQTQDDHPHPIFNHNSNAVYFTSDVTGKRAVYKVSLTDIGL